MQEHEFKGSIPASPKYVSFSMILHLNEEMSQKVYNYNNSNNLSPCLGLWPMAADKNVSI